MLSNRDGNGSSVARASGGPRLAFAIALCASLFPLPVRAGEEPLALVAKPDQQILIREHAGWDRNCAALAHPAITLDAPPAHGTVCARVENITIKYMFTGTVPQCVGHIVRGVRLFYQPHPGFAGPDALRYSVHYPDVRRAIAVSVNVETPAVRGAIRAEVFSPLPLPPQAPGPIPACTDRMS